MENSGGVLKLPPGFRFHPTDEELVVHYLKKKVLDHPLPARIIPEVDVCKSDPWDLPGEASQVKYFFSTREAKYHSGNRSNRATISGQWKATGIDKMIISSKSNCVLGLKKTLVFYRGKPSHCSKTNWIMHEYRLPNTETSLNVSSEAQIGDWVICRIFLKGSKDKEVAKKRSSSPVFFDFWKEKNTNLSTSSSSERSEITHVSGQNESEDSDVNSCGSFLGFRRT